MGFGTGIVPKGWGFSLQNRGHNFSLDPAHPNRLEPRKRPYHTIIPALITREADGSLVGPVRRDGRVHAAAGTRPGGAGAAARWHESAGCASTCRASALEDGNPSDAVALEEGIPVRVMAALAEMGHPVRPVSGWGRALFGRGQVILREPDGTLMGGSDPRADGCAMTLAG